MIFFARKSKKYASGAHKATNWTVTFKQKGPYETASVSMSV